jgi:uncharacterized membrane protein (DUF2068 family)
MQGCCEMIAARATATTTDEHEVGVGLIVAYKLSKAALQLVAAIAIGVALLDGETQRLHEAAARAVEHATSGWSLHLARLSVAATTTRHLHIAVLALALDGSLTLVEGWSLHRRYSWGPWLIVVATSGAVPFEVASLAKEVQPARLAVLILNIVLVLYLLLRALRHHARDSGNSRRAAGAHQPHPLP